MKIYTNTKVTFWIGNIIIYVCLLNVFSGNIYAVIGLLLAITTLTAVCPRKKITSKDIKIPDTICQIILIILLYWLSKEKDIMKLTIDFLKEYNYDYRFIGLTFIWYMSSAFKQYKELLSLTPQDVIEYYEPK